LHSSAMNSGEPAGQWTTLRPASSRTAWFGPEIGFGHRIAQLMPDANLAVIKHAVSGTNLAFDWKADSRRGRSGDRILGPQLKTFLDLVRNAVAKLREQGLQPRIRGMLWQQGEADARDERMANTYRENLSRFIQIVRDELDTPDMVFVYGHVLPVDNDLERQRFPFRDVVRQAQSDIDQDSHSSAAVHNALLVLTDDLTTHGQQAEGGRPTNDYTHFNTAGQLGLGRRFADRMHRALHVPEPATSAVWIGAGVFVLGWRPQKSTQIR